MTIEESAEEKAKKNIETMRDLINNLAEICWSDSTNELQKSIASKVHQELLDGTRLGGLTRYEKAVIGYAIESLGKGKSIRVGKIGKIYEDVVAVYEGGPRFKRCGENRHFARFRVSSGDLQGGLLVWNCVQNGWATQQGSNRLRSLIEGSSYKMTFKILEYREFRGDNQTFVQITKCEET